MIYLKSSPYPRFISTDDDERLSGYFLLIHKVGRKTRNNFHFAINGNVSLHVEIQFSQPSMASSMFKGLVTWWRVSGPVCNTIFGRVFALSLRQYLDAFTTGQNVSRGLPWSLKPCLAPNCVLMTCGVSTFSKLLFQLKLSQSFEALVWEVKVPQCFCLARPGNKTKSFQEKNYFLPDLVRAHSSPCTVTATWKIISSSKNFKYFKTWSLGASGTSRLKPP